jgi:hypothetical protein
MRDNIMLWGEFTWKVSNGDYAPDIALDAITIPKFGKFALGSPALKNWIADVAFGSLLHAIEDSFARGHVERVNN